MKTFNPVEVESPESESPVPQIQVERISSSDDLQDHHLQPQTIQWNESTDRLPPRQPSASASITHRPRSQATASFSGTDARRPSFSDVSESERDFELASPTLPPSAMPLSALLPDNRSFHDLELPMLGIQEEDHRDSDAVSLTSSSGSSRSASPDSPRGEDFNHPHRKRYRRRSTHRRGTSDSRAFNTPRRLTDAERRPTFSRDGRPRAPTVTSVVDSEDGVSHVDSNDNISEKAEEDVCFPMPDEAARDHQGIDFDVMEEFTKEMRQLLGTLDISEEEAHMEHHNPPPQPALRRDRSGSHVSSINEKRELSSTLHHHPAFNVPLRRTSTRNSVDEEKVNAIRGALPKLSKSGTMNSTGRAVPPPTLRVERRHDRFTFFTPGMEETHTAEEFCDLVQPGERYSELFDLRNGTWWLDVLNPSLEEMRMLSKAFNIHPLTNEDIRTQESREKVELFRTYYFVCFRSFESNPESEDYLEAANMYIVVFRGGLLTFHFTPSNHPANVRRRIRQLRDYVNVSSDWICYALIDDITDAFAPLVGAVEGETEAIEDAVMIARVNESGDMLTRISLLRKKIMVLLKLLGGKADVIKMFAKRCNENWAVAPTGEIGLYLGDIQDHIVTMFQNLSTFEKILSRAHGNYLAYLSVDSMQANNRINSLLSKLTLFTVIIVPMNLVTGLWGMNVHVPGQGVDGYGWFFGILAVILGWGLIFFLILWRLRVFRWG